MAFILATRGRRAGPEQREWLQRDPTNHWAQGKEVRGGRQETRKNSLLAQPGSGLMTLQLRHQI